jgi:precorrin-8X/cobalt-precorrin-8 methylmutase
MAAMREYLRDPEEISARSFAIAAAETDLGGVDAALRPIVLRLVHAAGDPQIAAHVRATPGAVRAGTAALGAGAAIFADCEMVAAGISRKGLPRANEVVCSLSDPRVGGITRERASTRSAAAVDLWDRRLAGAVVAIGNAPTALFRLIERLEAGAPAPALVIAMPVGFVGAAEAKTAFAEACAGIDHIWVTGRRGGSALAAATVNALAIGALANGALAIGALANEAGP